MLVTSLRIVQFLSFAVSASLAFDHATQAAETGVSGLPPRPNIVLIFTDDQGVNDVGCYGSSLPTPNIDSLARDGIKLTQFYAASSICTPSRFGLLTGRYAHRSHDSLTSALMFMSEEHADKGIRPYELTYVSLLQRAGYGTSLVGKWHLGHGDKKFWPTNHGFETFFGHTGGCVDFFTLGYGNRPDWYRGHDLVPTDGYATDVITDEAIKIVRGSAKRNEPFYLHVAYNAPHFGKGWDAINQTTQNIMQPKPADLAALPETLESIPGIPHKLRRAFAAKVVGLDQSIGRLLKTIDQLKIADETLVIFMTDHGGAPDFGGSNLPLRGGKATLFEGGIRVPCLARWPGVIDAGLTSDAVSCATDWFPTLCQITGIDTSSIDASDHRLDGDSILSDLVGRPIGTTRMVDSANRTLVWKTGAHTELGRKSWQAVRHGDWKIVSEPDKSPLLFNLRDDPGESRDLSADYPKILNQLLAIAAKD